MVGVRVMVGVGVAVEEAVGVKVSVAEGVGEGVAVGSGWKGVGDAVGGSVELQAARSRIKRSKQGSILRMAVLYHSPGVRAGQALFLHRPEVRAALPHKLLACGNI